MRIQQSPSGYCHKMLIASLYTLLTLVDFIFAVIAFVLLPINIVMVIRRFHDLDRTGWWTLLLLIPIIGWIWVLVWCLFFPGGRGKHNGYGPNPLNPPEDVVEVFGQNAEEQKVYPQTQQASEIVSERRECPVCAELIRQNAKKCRFCGADAAL